MEFLHNDNSNLPGFTQSINSFPTSLLNAYYDGFDACRENDIFGLADQSWAQLEDNGDGIPHQKGSMSNDGRLAAYTYL